MASPSPAMQQRTPQQPGGASSAPSGLSSLTCTRDHFTSSFFGPSVSSYNYEPQPLLTAPRCTTAPGGIGVTVGGGMGALGSGGISTAPSGPYGSASLSSALHSGASAASQQPGMKVPKASSSCHVITKLIH